MRGHATPSWPNCLYLHSVFGPGSATVDVRKFAMNGTGFLFLAEISIFSPGFGTTSHDIVE